MEIKNTTDYSMFSFIEGNRPLNQTNLNKLETSIKALNLLAANPILVNDRFEVIDGQHRLVVAEKLGLPIYYIVLPGEADLKEVHMLNDNRLNWSLSDYINSYISLGNPDYALLKSFAKNYNMPVTVCANLLYSSDRRSKNAAQIIKSGNFKINNLKKATALVENILELKPYFDTELWRDRDFISAISLVYKIVSPKKFKNKMVNYKAKLGRKVSVREYLRELEDIYNYRSHTETSFSFDRKARASV